MQKSLEIARKVRSHLQADLNKRAEQSTLVEFALDAMETRLPATSTKTHLEAARLALSDVFNLAVMIPEVLAIATIDTLTLPLRQKTA